VKRLWPRTGLLALEDALVKQNEDSVERERRRRAISGEWVYHELEGKM
jgi:hypothetical protein